MILSNKLNTYRITVVLKVETYIIISIAMRLIGPAVILMIMWVETLKTDIIVFIGNILMCLTPPCDTNDNVGRDLED